MLMRPQMDERKQLPGLDGLRALSVMAVILFHQYVFEFGWMGVQVFFVISGYLISRLLNRARDQELGSYLRGFYGRRALRIFPLYYTVLAGLAVIAFSSQREATLRQSLPYAATYTYNFWYATGASGYSYLITHFWTLCVEEQFYLVWPFVIFFCPERHLKRLFLGLVALGPVIRLVLASLISRPGATHLDDWHVAMQVLTPTHVDAFAMGALFSFLPSPPSRRWLAAGAAAFFGAGAILVVTQHLPLSSLGFPMGMGPGHAFVWAYTLLNLCSALLIVAVTRRQLLPRFFEAPPLVYLGKISYGLYAIHYPVQGFVDRVLPHGPFRVRLGLQCLLTLALASASYHLWEARFLGLKDRWFPAETPVPADSRQARAL
jgi:peptidoglycan/LPS O-acetylase OafA/YrhL